MEYFHQDLLTHLGLIKRVVRLTVSDPIWLLPLASLSFYTQNSKFIPNEQNCGSYLKLYKDHISFQLHLPHNATVGAKGEEKEKEAPLWNK